MYAYNCKICLYKLFIKKNIVHTDIGMHLIKKKYIYIKMHTFTNIYFMYTFKGMHLLNTLI